MINTVTGKQAISTASYVLPHEHVSIDYGQMIAEEKSHPPSIVNEFISVYSNLKSLGVEAVVDCTPPLYGRDISLLQKVSEASGVSIIASTGTFCEEWNPLPKFVYESSEESLLRFFVDELNFQCGNIKVAISTELQEVEAKALRAAGRAQLTSGATIVCHTTNGLGDIALEILSNIGVPLNKVTIAHVCAHGETVEYATKLAASGAYIGFDKIGHLSHTDQHWIGLLSQLKVANQISRVLLSQDTALSFTGPDLLGKKVFEDPAHLFGPFRRAIDNESDLKDEYHRLMSQNPSAWLLG
jgi:phosphotriesterase-related protein